MEVAEEHPGSPDAG